MTTPPVNLNRVARRLRVIAAILEVPRPEPTPKAPDTFTAGGFEIQGGEVVAPSDAFSLDRIAAAMAGYHVRGFPGDGATVWRAFDPAGRDLGTDESEAAAWRLAIDRHERMP